MNGPRIVTVGKTETFGILEAADLSQLEPGAIAGLAGWRETISDVAGPLVASPDWMLVLTSTEALRGLTLALIGICGSLGIDPRGPN